jgi:hypothetical protein
MFGNKLGLSGYMHRTVLNSDFRKPVGKTEVLETAQTEPLSSL